MGEAGWGLGWEGLWGVGGLGGIGWGEVVAGMAAVGRGGVRMGRGTGTGREAAVGQGGVG